MSCKHTVSYGRLNPNGCNQPMGFNDDSKSLPAFYRYDQLTLSYKEYADRLQEERPWMRCSEHCGNTVSEAK